VSKRADMYGRVITTEAIIYISTHVQSTIHHLQVQSDIYYLHDFGILQGFKHKNSLQLVKQKTPMHICITD
jgi:hypothetical protein